MVCPITGSKILRGLNHRVNEAATLGGSRFGLCVKLFHFVRRITFTLVFFQPTVKMCQDVSPRSSGHLAALPESHERLSAGHLMRALVASLVSPGLALVVG